MSDTLIPRRSGGRWFMIVTALAGSAAIILLQGIIIGLLRSSGLEAILGLQFSFTAYNFVGMVAGISLETLDNVIAHFTWDFALLTGYAATGYAVLYLLLTPKPRGLERLGTAHRVSIMLSYRQLRERRGLRFLPIIAGACDAGENILELLLLKGALEPVDPLVLLASLLSCGKFSLILLSLVIAIWTLLRRFSTRHFN